MQAGKNEPCIVQRTRITVKVYSYACINACAHLQTTVAVCTILFAVEVMNLGVNQVFIQCTSVILSDGKVASSPGPTQLFNVAR